MEKKESTKLNNLLCQLVQDTRDDERPLIFEDMLEITKLFEDHLNTQPQAEEITAEWLCEDNRRRMEKLINREMEERGFIKKRKSTPEQKEGWEFDLRNLMYRDGEQLRCAGEGKPYTGEYRELVISMVKNLLSERERWAIDTFLKDTASYNSFHNGRPRTMRNGLSGEGFEVRVSKLTTK